MNALSYRRRRRLVTRRGLFFSGMAAAAAAALAVMGPKAACGQTTPAAAAAAPLVRRANHVFIISFDGGKPTVMQQSKMPVFKKMMAEGAGTWAASTTFPSITLTSHTSMLTGVGPDKHKVLWNEWIPEKGMVTVPTVFGLARKAGLTTAMFVSKPKFIHLYFRSDVNEFSLPAFQSKTVAATAAAYIEKQKPNLCFIHFADSDDTGHRFGWGSPEQIQAFADEDAALAVVKKAIERAGIAGSSVVILTADHGGHGKGHGQNIPDDMIIPWVTWGAGVRRGATVTAPVTTYDTTATALWLLGVPQLDSFDGKPVTSAFTP